MTRRILPACMMLAAFCVPMTVSMSLRVGILFLVPYLIAAAFVFVIGYVFPSRTRVEYWFFAGDLIVVGAIAAAVALSGGSQSPVLGFFVFSFVAGATRYTQRGLVAFIGALMVAATLACVFATNRGVHYGDLRFLGFITGTLGIAVLVFALARAERDSREQSLVDPLTGVLNRLALNRRLEEMRAQAASSNGNLCVVAADLDHFKAVNDEYGHDVGDAVLREVADALRMNLRAFPLLYRTGGEEFVAILPGLSGYEGERISERLRVAVAELQPSEIPVTMSFGVASAEGRSLDPDEMLAAADSCLYRAKRLGRNRVVGNRTIHPLVAVAGRGRRERARPMDPITA